MTDTMTLRALRHTPMRDLVRGRITGRLDWRGKVAAALPPPAAALVARVVKRTRLWRIEKAAVADELIGHFTDGIAAGATPEQLVRDFGDPRSAAKLIRRAVRRKRPLGWHAMKWTRRVAGVLLLLYAIVLLRYFMGTASPRVDYLAKLNENALSTPRDDRAWPILRTAIAKLGLEQRQRPSPIEERSDPDEQGRWHGESVIDAKPGDAAWDKLVAWIDANADGIALVRAGAAKRKLGFVLGRNGDAEDWALGSSYHARDEKGNVLPVDPPWLHRNPIVEESLISVLLPYLQQSRQLAQILAADIRVALVRRDGDRITRDLIAMQGLARQLEPTFVIDQLVRMGIDSLMLESCASVLREAPELLSDATLVDLAHHLARLGGDDAASVVTVEGERTAFYDMVQRLYTDDGHGDGRLTRLGATSLPMISSIAGSRATAPAEVASFFGFGSIANTRHDVVTEFDRLLDTMSANLARPIREVAAAGGFGAVDRRLAEIRESPTDSVRFLPVLLLAPSSGRVQITAERLLGLRDGVQVGIALEIHRRRNAGAYPATLDALVPTLLPAVPVDRITGEPLRYRLVDGRPVVYSVGIDHDDDGGLVYVDPKTHEPDPHRPADWRAPEDDGPIINGDWVLFDARPARASGL